MTAYDLSRLNDKEFEEFAMQMIGTVTGQKVERFKAGQDRGVDPLFCCSGLEPRGVRNIPVVQIRRRETTSTDRMKRPGRGPP